MLPENFERDGRALTDAIQVFGQYRSYRSSFALALVLLYALFAIPLLLISLLVAFHTGSEIVKPIVNLEEAMRRHEAPFYLRRVKEAMVSFPDPDTGKVKSLFTRRLVKTIEFEIDSDEWDLYNSLTEYVQ